jgi:hypothetical protein
VKIINSRKFTLIFFITVVLFSVNICTNANNFSKNNSAKITSHTKTIVKTKTKVSLKKKIIRKHRIANIKRYKAGYFTSIETDGNFSIQIQRGRKSYVEISGEGARFVDASITGGTLILRDVDPDPDPDPKHAKEPIYFPAATVKVSMSYLDNLYLQGQSFVRGSNIRSHGLCIDANGRSYVLLNGVVDVHQIFANDNSRISIQWVDNNDLQVEGRDYSHIYMAGVAKLLHARLSGKSSLDAKYLRARTVLVQTIDNAVAEVLAIKALYAFANGCSDVYFYKRSRYIFMSSQLSGNVLQMGNWDGVRG